MTDHPIEGLMKTTMESIKGMIDVNTIVGNPVQTPDGQVIIPISKVSFGFASGGGNYVVDREVEDETPFAGGSGAGVSVQPVAFMVVGNNKMKLLPVDQGSNMLNSILDFIPKMSNEMKKNDRNKNRKSNDSDICESDYEN